MDYPGRPNIISGVLRRGMHEGQSKKKKNVMTKAKRFEDALKRTGHEQGMQVASSS